MMLLNNVCGEWIAGQGPGQPLFDPVLGTELARASTQGVDYGAALDYARQVGGANLRRLSFAERATLLNRIAEVLTAKRDSYYEIALANSGSPAADAAFDIDGAIYTLKYYAKAAKPLGDAHYLKDGDFVRLGKDESFQALHLAAPLRGVAIHINAFNFPAWGLWEKAAPTLLSGVPIFAKPATSTAWLAQRMVEDVANSGVLPAGALSIACGSAGDLLDHVTGDDAVVFTGSAATAVHIRSHPAVVRNGARLNIEADSLNSVLLGPDVKAGDPEFDLFIKEVAREMTLKAGQKCTAIRRILVPAPLLTAVSEALIARLAKVSVGNPRNPSVKMGPLVSQAQQTAVQEGIAALSRDAEVVFAGGPDFRLIDADPSVGAFVPPTLLICSKPLQSSLVHDEEVFGPVATLMAYDGLEQALDIARLGKGSLVASVFSGDDAFIEAALIGLAGSQGRILAINREVGPSNTGHGNVMPMCLHGGPGRAGGGEELGGLRALRFYHRLSALQGPLKSLQALAQNAAELRY
ncbi:MAG: 3,4-dehydroadipyl-CoA semialdehyde dehydrogenase [Gammaproteobacteria bacterium]|nr:3,4-dehydroadipyl-CoA semialdehyde dehydrogenase [Gammaproteobacteria bacterium]MCP5458395.1 3,4-dehydroadipyl-CoA semialdehyde dehydrogenase [Gammaproteobacteria bacterium]